MHACTEDEASDEVESSQPSSASYEWKDEVSPDQTFTTPGGNTELELIPHSGYGSALLPVFCVCDVVDIVAAIARALYHRRACHVEEPVIGIVQRANPNYASFGFGWLEQYPRQSGELPTAHVVFDQQQIFNLGDPFSLLLFSQTLLLVSSYAHALRASATAALASETLINSFKWQKLSISDGESAPSSAEADAETRVAARRDLVSKRCVVVFSALAVSVKTKYLSLRHEHIRDKFDSQKQPHKSKLLGDPLDAVLRISAEEPLTAICDTLATIPNPDFWKECGLVGSRSEFELIHTPIGISLPSQDASDSEDNACIKKVLSMANPASIIDTGIVPHNIHAIIESIITRHKDKPAADSNVEHPRKRATTRV
ncbi:hypothetical protein DXG03_000484 [Asterophora parasitica]|uniref:Uncharacterized protein n=1 Tax=Asterophora parasitica TaxID=117018 RepID=A0A9P7KEB5_9AGAR|nr:hypothetical protein DXG03_000484 [Asterophora parasitica]